MSRHCSAIMCIDAETLRSEAWRRLSRYKLQAQPLYELCLRAGKIEPAALVDHIVALEDGGGLLPAIDGLMSMCISCHNMKHAGGIRGCDVDGMPLDPSIRGLCGDVEQE